MRLILVRHGETYANVKKLLDTEPPGAALTETGWTQANDVVTKILDYEPDSIWVSNTLRTRQTATPLSVRTGLEINERAGLREIAAGEYEGLSDDEVIYDYLGVVMGWVKGEREVRLGGGVDGNETLERFDSVIREIEASGSQSAVVFSHGAMIGYWTAVRGEGATEEMKAIRLLNTGMAVLDGTLESGYRLRRWAHLTLPEA